MITRRASGLSPLVAVMVVVVLVMVVVVGKANGDLGPSQCKEEKDILVKECPYMLFGRNPSQSCCQRIREAHEECVCPAVTPAIALLVNIRMRWLIQQAEGCGRTIPHHYKCGRVTTP